MKASILLCVLVSWFPPVASASDEPNRFTGLWRVNWDKSPSITTVPERYAGLTRFKNVEEYRDFVARRGKDLVLEVQTNGTAVLRYAAGKNETYRWGLSPETPKYDIWLQMRPHLMAASVGHGFKVSDASGNTAILTFQLEWDETVATRVPLVMERQQPNSDKTK